LKRNLDPRYIAEQEPPHWSPVAIRVMNNEAVKFYEHESANEMFLVLSGTLFIDIKKNTNQKDSDSDFQVIKLLTGESYTVGPGITHRARVVGRAELIVIGGTKVN